MASLAPVEIPYAPRPLQRVVHQLLDQHRWVVGVCHRRFGKSVLAVNHLQKGALLCTKPRPRFAYLAPTYRQGKATVWDYMKHYAAPIPGVLVNESELRIDYPNGAQVRIYGADNPDSLRGLYLDGVILDEYGLMPPTVFSEVILPTLVDRTGWALFIGTPKGKNQFYDVVKKARAGEDGYVLFEYRASQTGILEPADLDAARGAMTQDEYDQEFECSFEASVKGAVFAQEMQAAREAGRITRVPYDQAMLVDTDWDLGYGDATAIWFSQSCYTGEVRLIDYYENTGQGLAHYKQVLTDRGYTYGTHWAPHDIQVHELTSGHSRLALAQGLGLNFQTTPRVEHKEDGVHAAKLLFSRCWFDAEHCGLGLEALQHYRWDYNERLKGFTHLPVHDWASHGADAFMGLAYHQYQPRKNPERSAAAATRLAQKDSDPYDRMRARYARGRGGY